MPKENSIMARFKDLQRICSRRHFYGDDGVGFQCLTIRSYPECSLGICPLSHLNWREIKIEDKKPEEPVKITIIASQGQIKRLFYHIESYYFGKRPEEVPKDSIYECDHYRIDIRDK